MSAISNQDLDALILSLSRTQWQKVAMIVSRVFSACKRNGIDVDVDVVADRIRTLVEDGSLQSQGNLSRWRHSEGQIT